MARLCVALSLFISAVIFAATSAAPALPEPTGRYGVGRVSYHFIDPSRPEPLSGNPNAQREVMVYVWYPTKPGVAAHTPTAPYMPGFDAVKSKLSEADINDLFRPAKYAGQLPKTHTIENAPIAPRNNKFPLLLFSHGWGNPIFLYTAELEDMASHGYVIAAVEHPYDTTFTQFPDGRVVFFAQNNFDAAVKKPNGMVAYARERVAVMAEDNRFVLEQLLKYANTRTFHAPFFHRIDETRIGAFGHSIGGLAAARTCQIEARVKACMDQDSADDRGSAFILSDIKQTETQPFLLFVAASADVTSPRALNPTDAELARNKLTRAEFNASMKRQQTNQLEQLASIPGGSYRVTLYDLPGFVHRSFTDQTLLPSTVDAEQSLDNFRVAQTFTLAFFDKYLKGNRHTVLDTGEVVDPRAKVEKFPAH